MKTIPFGENEKPETVAVTNDIVIDNPAGQNMLKQIISQDSYSLTAFEFANVTEPDTLIHGLFSGASQEPRDMRYISIIISINLIFGAYFKKDLLLSLIFIPLIF